MTLVCVPITVEEIDASLVEAQLAKDMGADLVEFRIDSFFHGSEGDDADTVMINELRRLIAESALPVILTCRPTWEGGDYDGDEVDRISLFEKLCVGTDHPPAYLDVELAAYSSSKNLRQKVNLCVNHPKQQREVSTRLILSMHDFETRPSDLMRKLAEAWAEPAASVVKFAFHARSIRDNLEVFEILREAPKPTIGLCMGEFGLMSRVLAPKFGGYLTFASLRESSGTAPGQPTMAELLGMYRFRSIGKDTKVYGVIGWPVGHSMSPLIHNAGFEARGWDGVYLPMPVAESDESFKATMLSLMDDGELGFSGASVTLPHKARLAGLERLEAGRAIEVDGLVRDIGAANTLTRLRTEDGEQRERVSNTDAGAVLSLIANGDECEGLRVCVFGAGGVARAVVLPLLERGAVVELHHRSAAPAEAIAADSDGLSGELRFVEIGSVPMAADVYVNCTPIGMAGGADPDGSPLDVASVSDSHSLPASTVFFDTVYNPIETPMLKAAKECGFETIDGVQLFVKQAAAQFKLWTGEDAPEQLFDRLVRETLVSDEGLGG